MINIYVIKVVETIEVPGENTSNEWCEPVTDEEYDKLN